MAARRRRAARDGARAAPPPAVSAGPSMPPERGTIVGLETVEPNVRKLRPQECDDIESRHAPAPAEELAHAAFRPVPPDRSSDPACGDDPQSASVEAVRKREQRQVTAPDAGALPLDREEIPAPSNPVMPGQCPTHVCTPPRAAAEAELHFDWRPAMRTATASPAITRRLRLRLPPDRASPGPCPVLRRRLLGHGETLAPLRATPPDDLPAALRAHPLPESVRPLAAPVVGLIRPLHALVSSSRSRPRRQNRYQTAMVISVRASCQRSRLSPRSDSGDPIPVAAAGRVW